MSAPKPKAPKTGHLVGWDPAIKRVVILRKGQDGKAARQVDVLTVEEATKLRHDLTVVIVGIEPPIVHAIPEPIQTELPIEIEEP